ncbi:MULTISPECIES: hypothetical protein [unclassified Synechococcus]
MTDVDYLVIRFHELFRRQESRRQLKRLTYEQQEEQKSSSEDGEELK